MVLKPIWFGSPMRRQPDAGRALGAMERMRGILIAEADRADDAFVRQRVAIDIGIPVANIDGEMLL